MCFIPMGLLLSLIAFVVVFKLEFLPTNVILYEHKTMYNDWQASPYIDIVIEPHDFGCPDDYEVLFSRPWNGTYDLCVTDEKNNDYRILSESDTSCTEGRLLKGMPAQNLTNINGMIVCAKRGGPNFKETNHVFIEYKRELD